MPPEQAFGVDAIAGDGNTLLLRFTPAPGYYLYRDKTRLELAGRDGSALEGITLDRPRWPKGVSHRDEHFGDVIVYFDQVEVPVPVRREHADAVDGTLTVGFQGCQTDGICYPPMTRTLAVSLPAGSVTPKPKAGEMPAGTVTEIATADAGDATPPRHRHSPPAMSRMHRRRRKTPASPPRSPARARRGRCWASSAPACCWRSRPACCR